MHVDNASLLWISVGAYEPSDEREIFLKTRLDVRLRANHWQVIWESRAHITSELTGKSVANRPGRSACLLAWTRVLSGHRSKRAIGYVSSRQTRFQFCSQTHPEDRKEEKYEATSFRRTL